MAFIQHLYDRYDAGITDDDKKVLFEHLRVCTEIAVIKTLVSEAIMTRMFSEGRVTGASDVDTHGVHLVVMVPELDVLYRAELHAYMMLYPYAGGSVVSSYEHGAALFAEFVTRELSTSPVFAVVREPCELGTTAFGVRYDYACGDVRFMNDWARPIEDVLTRLRALNTGSLSIEFRDVDAALPVQFWHCVVGAAINAGLRAQCTDRRVHITTLFADHQRPNVPVRYRRTFLLSQNEHRHRALTDERYPPLDQEAFENGIFRFLAPRCDDDDDMPRPAHRRRMPMLPEMSPAYSPSAPVYAVVSPTVHTSPPAQYAPTDAT